MLKQGIPLEGALRQLCQGLAQSPVRTELERLEADLAKGASLPEAIAARRLPPLYVALVQAGARGNDLPGVLTLLADHYARLGVTWTRLRALMLYPVLVYLALVVLLCLFAWLYGSVASVFADTSAAGLGFRMELPWTVLWLPITAFTLLTVTGLGLLTSSQGRRWASWRLPGFKEASCAQFGGTMNLLLRSGNTPQQSLDLMVALEGESELGRELVRWRARLALGHGKFAEWVVTGSALPPLFLWLLAQAGEDLVGGFSRAAEIYQERARHRIEMMLYAALPVSVMGAGLLITWQLIPLFATLVQFLNSLGSMD